MTMTGKRLTVERQHEIRYYVQNVYIPNIVQGVNDGYLPYIALIPSMGPWYYNIRQYFDQEDIMAAGMYENIEKREVGEDYMLIIYTFPEPEQVSEAAYGIALFNRLTNQAEYYTLETSCGGQWAIANKTTIGDPSFEICDFPDKEKFVEWVKDRILG